MCGIAGMAAPLGRTELAQTVGKMNHQIFHRGPDDEGTWASDDFAFGMRRLSIIDIEGGHQPIFSENGTGIVFNGEIYNFAKLREELQAQGRNFKTRSDTEVVLALFEAEGISCVHRLEGMFAFCIYDPRNRRVYLARDRMGIKPLYYSVKGKNLIFGSEIKAVLEAFPQRPKIDLESLSHFLSLRYLPSPKTIWKGIHKLEPGHRLEWKIEKAELSLNRYWQLGFQSQILDPTRNYVREFEDLFLSSVQDHLVASDVPVGVMLSGGLDSSTVAAAAVELGHRNFHTFCVGFKDSLSFDETPYAREIAKQIGSQHHEVWVSQEDFINFLPEFARYIDEPVADLASIPLYFLSLKAKEFVKVVLSGEGSDEILAGYDIERLARVLDLKRSFTGLLPKKLARAFPWSESLRSRGTHISRVWSDLEKKALLRSELAGSFSTSALIRTWYEEAQSLHPIDQLQQVYCKSWLVEDLLMKADKMSMAASLELRVPFLHPPLVEWAEKLPIEWKVGTRKTGYSSKRILREFALKRLPPSIIERKKQGFPVPAYRWLQSDLGSWARDFILGRSSRVPELLHTEPLEAALRKSQAGDLGAAHRVWSTLILEQWLRVWT